MKLNWRGAQVLEQVERSVGDALGDIGLECEKAAKANLYPGHGYDTGSMQRGVHCAKPGHNWEALHQYPDGPELGGVHVRGEKGWDGLLHIECGTPQLYSLIVHIKWYPFMFVGLRAATAAVPSIVAKYRLR